MPNSEHESLISKAKLGLLGAQGRMGRAIVSALENIALQGDIKLVLTAEAGRADDAGAVFDACDVILDFSVGATKDHAALAQKYHKAYVTGTTGMSAQDHSALDQAAKTIPLVQADNFSQAIAVLSHLTAQAARALGDDFDLEITEMHHRHKKDAPSGTALMLAQVIENNRAISTRRYGRQGMDSPRRSGELAIHALRAGGVIGDHTISFTSMDEQLTLHHRALDRHLFAKGALKACAFALKAKAGRYTMADVMGLA